MIPQHRLVSPRVRSLLWQCCAFIVMIGGVAAQASAEDEYDQWLESFQPSDVQYRLQAANAAESAGQYSRAAKAFHDIMTKSSGGLMRVNGESFVSVHRYCLSRITSKPDLLRAYRELTETKATVLIAEARRNSDRNKLVELAKLYILTNAGIEAMAEQAEILMECGDFATAAEFLQDVVRFSQNDQQRISALKKLLICAAKCDRKWAEELAATLRKQCVVSVKMGGKDVPLATLVNAPSCASAPLRPNAGATRPRRKWFVNWEFKQDAVPVGSNNGLSVIADGNPVLMTTRTSTAILDSKTGRIENVSQHPGPDCAGTRPAILSLGGNELGFLNKIGEDWKWCVVTGSGLSETVVTSLSDLPPGFTRLANPGFSLKPKSACHILATFKTVQNEVITSLAIAGRKKRRRIRRENTEPTIVTHTIDRWGIVEHALVRIVPEGVFAAPLPGKVNFQEHEDNGRVTWTLNGSSQSSADQPSLGDEIIETPGAVFVAIAGGMLVRMDKDTGLPVWAVRIPAGPTPINCPAIDKRAMASDCRNVYVAYDGRCVVAVDMTTGEIRWTRSVHSDAAASLKLVDGTLYVFGRRASGSVMAIDPHSSDVRWQKTLGDGNNMFGDVAGGEVFIPTDKELYILNAETGKEENSFKWRHGGSVTVAGDRLFVSRPEGVTCFAISEDGK